MKYLFGKSFSDILGTGTALIILLFCILIFIFRLAGWPKAEYRTGMMFLCCSLPLVFLMIMASRHERPVIFYIQTGTMLVFIVVELLFDYILQIEFRHIRWMTILYVTLFFAATGGMIGLASISGRFFTFCTIILFLVMAFLAFYQRAKTGM